MANLETVITILFGADTSIATKELRGLASRLDSFSGVISDVAQPLATLGKSIIAVNLALGALATTYLALAVKKSFELEGAQLDLNKVLKDGSDGLQRAGENAKFVSDKYGESRAEIIASTAVYKQAGFTIDESMTLAEKAIRLVTVSELDAAGASEALVSILKGLELPAKDAESILDKLNEVSNQFAVNVTELTVGLQETGPVLKAAGYDLDEMIGILTPGIEVFRSGSEVARAFRTAIGKLADDSPEVVDTLKQFGISQRDSNRELKQGKVLFEELGAKLQGYSEQQRLATVGTIFGTDQSAKLLTVLNKLDVANAAAAVSADSFGSAEREVAIQLASDTSKYDIGVAAIENFSTALGVTLRGSVADAVSGLGDLAKGIEKGLDAGSFSPILNIINDFGTNSANLFREIAENIPAALKLINFGTLTEALQNLGNEFLNLFNIAFTDFDPSDPQKIADAIQSVIDTIAGLVNIMSGIVGTIGPFITDAISQLQTLDSKSAESFGKVLAAAILVADAGVVIAAAIVAISESGIKLTDIWNWVAGSIGATWNTLKVIVDADALIIVHALLGIVQSIRDVVDVLPFLQGSLDATVQSLTNFKSAIEEQTIEDMAATAKRADQALKGWNGILGNTTETVKELNEEGKKTQEWVSNIQWDGFIDGSKEAVKTVTEEIQKIREPVYASVFIQTETGELEELKFEVSEFKTLASEPITIPIEVDKDAVAKYQAELKADSDRIASYFSYKAKVDTSAIVGFGESAIAIAGSISEAFTSTGDALSSLFGAYIGATDLSTRWQIEDWIRTQENIQRETLALQEKQLNAVIEYYNYIQSQGNVKTIEFTGLDELNVHAKIFLALLFEDLKAELVNDGAPILAAVV